MNPKSVSKASHTDLNNEENPGNEELKENFAIILEMCIAVNSSESELLIQVRNLKVQSVKQNKSKRTSPLKKNEEEDVIKFNIMEINEALISDVDVKTIISKFTIREIKCMP